MTNTMDTPTEALERAYPLRVLRYRLREGSGGRGRAAGGDGIERVIQVLEPGTLSLITERRGSRPWGLAGGEPGCGGENWLWPGGDESRRTPLLDKVTIALGGRRRRPDPHARRRRLRAASRALTGPRYRDRPWRSRAQARWSAGAAPDSARPRPAG